MLLKQRGKARRAGCDQHYPREFWWRASTDAYRAAHLRQLRHAALFPGQTVPGRTGTPWPPSPRPWSSAIDGQGYRSWKGWLLAAAVPSLCKLAGGHYGGYSSYHPTAALQG
ncbi:hypothetical protein PAHAL_4G072900 [Panicum hallii]|uniref:Uncharacterized protein n=1 Tax=Panicum hallii TaxID=206008 RepID=A0A2S3HHY9_9POAL|nr:hypothetical protein PAHAL_4G072900 [Panicum hallii]